MTEFERHFVSSDGFLDVDPCVSDLMLRGKNVGGTKIALRCQPFVRAAFWIVDGQCRPVSRENSVHEFVVECTSRPFDQ